MKRLLVIFFLLFFTFSCFADGVGVVVSSENVSDEYLSQSEENLIKETDSFADYVVKTYGETVLKEAAKFGVVMGASKLLECAMSTPAGDALKKQVEGKIEEFSGKALGKLKEFGSDIPMIGGVVNAAAGSEYDVMIARWAKLIDSVDRNTARQQKLRRSTVNKFAEGVKTGNKILDLATGLYQGYQTLVAYMETVNEAIQGAKEVKQLKDYAEKIINLYDEYGVTFGKNGLYELDKYLNPAQKRHYCEQMQNRIDQVQYVIEQTTYLTGTKSLGVTYSDSWRLMQFRELLRQMQILEADMYGLISTTMYLCQINYRNDQFVDCMERCWNFWDYDTYSVW